jgi:hypothetical protein
VEQPIDTDKQLTIGKPPVDDEQVAVNVVHVSEPVNKKQNELQVLDHESGNLEPVDDEPPVGPVIPHA